MCCLLEPVNGRWQGCKRAAVRPLTRMLQRITVEKRLQLRVDEFKVSFFAAGVSKPFLENFAKLQNIS